MSTPPPTPPGWHPDPSGPPGQQRWWDGHQWTGHTAPAPAPERWVKPEGQRDGLLIAGVTAGIVLPFLGLVLAIILFAKGRAAHGMAVLLCCLVGVLLGVSILYG